MNETDASLFYGNRKVHVHLCDEVVFFYRVKGLFFFLSKGELRWSSFSWRLPVMSSKQALDSREVATALLVFFYLLFWLLLLDCVPSPAFIIIIVPAAVSKMVDASPLLSSSFSLSFHSSLQYFLEKTRNEYCIYMNSARQIESSINAVRGQNARLGIHTHTHTYLSVQVKLTRRQLRFFQRNTPTTCLRLSFFFFTSSSIFFSDSARIAVRAETRRNSFFFSH